MAKGQLRAIETAPPVETLEHPRLTELEASKLETALLRVELLESNIRGLSRDLETRRVELQALVKNMERPNWVLHRMADGAWLYQPAPPKSDSA